jgi:hypothetical protein
VRGHLRWSHDAPAVPVRNARRERRAFNRAFVDVRTQAAEIPSHKQRRAERDAQQQLAAKQRLLREWKALPKEDRERLIREARDKRVCDPYEVQNGRVLAAGAGVAVGVLLSKIFGFAKKTSKVLDSVSVFVQQLIDVGEGLKKHLGPILWSIPLTLTLYFFLSKKGVGNPLILSTITSALSVVLGKRLWRVVAKFFRYSDNTGVQLQSGMLEHAPKLLATMMSFSMLGKKMTQSNITELCKRIAMIDRVAGGWETFLRWMMDALQGVFNYVRVAFGKERIELYKSVHKPLQQWASRVDAAFCRHSTAAADLSTQEVNDLISLVREGHGFKEVYRNTTMSRYVDDYNIKVANLLHPYLGSVNARNNFRFEPIACMLLGSPGIGKTMMAMPLCSAVLKLSGLMPVGATPDEVKANIWQKGTSEYWNGYANQLCLVMDDAFQQRANATDKDNEFINIIRTVSSWSFPLNFADLTSKGKIFFGSKFIFGTTNVASIDADARLVLHAPDAVSRRIGYSYKLVLKQVYRDEKGRLDIDSFRRELARCGDNEAGLDRFPWYMWEVYKHDFLTGATAAQPMPLRELIVQMANDLRTRSTQFGEAQVQLDEFIRGFDQAAAADASVANLPDVVTPTPSPSGLEEYVNVELQTGGVKTLLRSMSMDDVLQEAAETRSEVKRVATSLEELRAELRLFMAQSMACHTVVVGFINLAVFAIGSAVAFRLVRSILHGFWSALRGAFAQKKKDGPEPATQSNRPLRAKCVRVNPDSVVLQAGDQNVCSNAYSNTYKISIALKSGAPFIMGQVCFLVSELAVQPEHFTPTVRDLLKTEEIDLDSVITFRNSDNHQHVFEYSVRKYLSLKRHSDAHNDVEFLLFEDVRAHRNIVTNFMREADVKYLSGNKARLDICDIDDRRKITPRNNRAIYVFDKIIFGERLAFHGRRLNRYFSYQAPTSAGDCGGVLCILDNSSYSGRTVIGFHVSGDVHRSVGFSNIVTQEMIRKAQDVLVVTEDQFLVDLESRTGVKPQCGNYLPFPEPGSFLPICEVDKPVTICPKTSYYVVPSLYGVFGEYSHMPAPLTRVWRNGELVYPMFNAVAPFATQLQHFEQPFLSQAMHTAMTKLTAKTAGCSRRIYTFEEAIIGVAQEKFRSIPRSTAAGFPYIYDVRDGKKEFFGDGEVYDLTKPKALELRERVACVIDNARRNVRLCHVFVDFLKDELRSPAKVEAVATRLISSAPLDYVVAWRMYFGAFTAAMMRHHTETGMAPGICTYTDWDVLVAQLQCRGSKVFDGDFKGFDSSEQPCVHGLILDYVNRWYDDGSDNARIRKVLWMDLVHSRHIGGPGDDQRYIYQWNKSLPSGHPFTTIVNSMYSLFLLVAAYIAKTGDLTGFWDNVSAVTYGDDNAVNVSDVFCDVFNQVTVAETLAKEFKVTYTPGRKDGNWTPTMDITDITFLKRGFYCENDTWLCPLELESFLYTCYWCKNRKLESKIVHDVLEMALEELSMHPQRIWDAYAPQVYSVLEKLGHVPKALLDKNQYLAVVRSRSDNWY